MSLQVECPLHVNHARRVRLPQLVLLLLRRNRERLHLCDKLSHLPLHHGKSSRNLSRRLAGYVVRRWPPSKPQMRCSVLMRNNVRTSCRHFHSARVSSSASAVVGVLDAAAPTKMKHGFATSTITRLLSSIRNGYVGMNESQQLFNPAEWFFLGRTQTRRDGFAQSKARQFYSLAHARAQGQRYTAVFFL